MNRLWASRRQAVSRPRRHCVAGPANSLHGRELPGGARALGRIIFHQRRETAAEVRMISRSGVSCEGRAI